MVNYKKIIITYTLIGLSCACSFQFQEMSDFVLEIKTTYYGFDERSPQPNGAKWYSDSGEVDQYITYYNGGLYYKRRNISFQDTLSTLRISHGDTIIKDSVFENRRIFENRGPVFLEKSNDTVYIKSETYKYKTPLFILQKDVSVLGLDIFSDSKYGPSFSGSRQYIGKRKIQVGDLKINTYVVLYKQQYHNVSLSIDEYVFFDVKTLVPCRFELEYQNGTRIVQKIEKIVPYNQFQESFFKLN